MAESNASSLRGGPTAIVVGAGVSGCACAAVLAEQGVKVTVLNSALDRVNLPAYDPALVAGSRGWCEIEETMAVLPLPLRRAWLSSAAVPESGVPVLLVDRRAVSIETKRALERMPGLRFRQGLVTDLRLESSPREDYEGCLGPGSEPASSCGGRDGVRRVAQSRCSRSSRGARTWRLYRRWSRLATRGSLRRDPG